MSDSTKNALDILAERQTGTQRRLELHRMRSETYELVKTWRSRGIDFDVIMARFQQAIEDVAREKHAVKGMAHSRSGRTVLESGSEK